jgi:hypothetical protein
MNKTIYLRDEEGPIWERARELAGDKLSPVIVSALKRFIAEEENKPRDFERILLEFNDAADHNLPKRKAFYGRWILPTTNPYTYEQHPGRDDGGCTDYCAVAVTAKGNAVFYTWSEDPGGDLFYFKFKHFESLASAAVEREFNGPARAAIEKIGVPIEELPI